MKRLFGMLALAVLAGAWGCKANDTNTAGTSGSAAPEVTSNPSTSSGGAIAAGTVTLPSGLQYEDLALGDGPVAESGMQTSVHYTGWLADGTKFDSSLDRGEPIVFRLGSGNVIRGWDEGVKGMKVGGKRKLTIPPHLGYGAAGRSGVIPPDATLVFEVELVAVQ